MRCVGVCVWLAVMSVYDFQRKEIPQRLLLFGGICGLGSFLALIVGERMVSFYELLGALGAGILLQLFAVFTKAAGIADGMIVAIVGLTMGARYSNMMFCFALLFASAYSGYLLLFRKATRNESFPFVPFLLLGCVLAAAVSGGRAWE